MTVTAHAHCQAAEIALSIYTAALSAVSPSAVVGRKCGLSGSTLTLGNLAFELGRYNRILLAGAGKASCGIALELIRLLGDRVKGGLVVTKDGHGLDLGSVRVIEASHPQPDERSLQAGEAMCEFAQSTREDDLILFVLSGGASALMEKLEEGISLEDLQGKTNSALASGQDITAINQIRKTMSRLKGGKLGRAFKGQTVCLVLSDVLGDDFATIGSGPLWDASSSSVIPHVLLGNLETAMFAAEMAAKDLNIRASRDPRWIFTGEARMEAASWIPEVMKDESIGSAVWIGGGETVVTVRGDGLGGRCQEFVCSSLPFITVPNFAVLAGSTDGTDGPTDASGGLADSETKHRARNGWSVPRALATNDSYHFLEATGALIKTGPTQSNVNDLYICARGDLR